MKPIWSLNLLLLITLPSAFVGCLNPSMPQLEAKRLQEELLDLEWKISEKWAEANRIATSPVIPGRVDVVPTTDPFNDRYRIVRGESIYIKDGGARLSRLHEEIESLSARYLAIEKQLRDGGRSAPRLAKCERCDGNGLAWGPHYELGRQDDGSLGMVFKTSGLHSCRACSGAGVQKPADD